jgi:dTDP-4-dehydrorhamnose 3,5-epimerase
MNVIALPLEGAAEITTAAAQDSRGWFARFFCQRELDAVNGGRAIQQVNCSHTERRGTIRGLHFQRAPHAEDKVVRCIAGRVFDVMVDLRPQSATYGAWHGVVLDAALRNMVYIPAGFAHGFQTLEDHCEVLYLHTQFHAPQSEAGFRHDSPALHITWPLPVTDLSERDAALPVFDPATAGVTA